MRPVCPVCPVLLLAVLQGLALNPQHQEAVLYAYAVAIVAFVLMEQTSDRRMAWLTSQFTAQGIVRDSARAGFVKARWHMERRSGSALAEGVMLVAAYLVSYFWLKRGASRVDGGTWVGQVTDAALRPTLAGWWTLLVALPLFWVPLAGVALTQVPFRAIIDSVKGLLLL
jgi:hypothetical protein